MCVGTRKRAGNLGETPSPERAPFTWIHHGCGLQVPFTCIGVDAEWHSAAVLSGLSDGVYIGFGEWMTTIHPIAISQNCGRYSSPHT